MLLVGEPVGVDADHRLGAGVDPGLGAGRRLLDAHLGDALLDRLGHAAGLLGLEDVRPGPLGEVVGEPLDVVGAGPRVDDAGGAALLLQQQLGVAGDPGREVGRQRDRLVEGVGVQRLGVPLGRGHRLDAGAADVVEDVLRGERPAAGLAVRAQRSATWGSAGRTRAPAVAHSARAARILATSMKKFIPIAQKKLSRGAKRVDVQAGGQPGADVLHAVGQRVGQLEVGGRPGLLHVVAGDRDRVEARHRSAPCRRRCRR